MPADQIQYSERYYDDKYEYRHVILPPDIACQVPRQHLMTETEWRNLGVQQSPNWQHFMVHKPERHVLLFRRPRTDLSTDESEETQPKTDSELPNTAIGLDEHQLSNGNETEICFSNSAG